MQAKRILLMHISNISGHRSASLAIEKAINTQSPQSKTLNLNVFNYIYPSAEKVVNLFYMFLIKKLPFVWSHLYDNPRWLKRTNRLKGLIHYANLPKLEVLFNDFCPDVVVSTQAFPCGIVADFKRIKGVDLPLVAVLTDFAPHSYWIYDTIDYYVVPSWEVGQRFIKKNVEPNRIKSLGIPFDLKFNHKFDKFEIRKKLNLRQDLFTILIMGGGQGLGPIRNIVEILDKLKFDIQEIVVCGMNRKAFNWLRKRLKFYKKRISLFCYAHNVEELMSASDVVITKPGGVTCAEALSKGLPMVIISPIPGQEADNTAYLIAQGAAVKADSPEKLIEIISDLYNRPEKLKALSNAALSISKPNASVDIARLLLEL